MDFDFKPPISSMARYRRKKAPLAGILLCFVLIAVALLLLYREFPPSFRPAETAGQETPAAPLLPEIRREVVADAIRPGDTISSLLGTYFSPREIYELGRQSRGIFPLSNICAGQPYKICLTDGVFERFEYDIDRDDQLVIRHTGETFDVDRVAIDYQVETVAIQGTIDSSLFETVAELGEEPELALALADIFAWDVDFVRDIRVGDAFSALVEKRYREGKPAGYGRIRAAEFFNRGERYLAVLFKDGDQPASYYDADGKSVRKAFLKAPLAFSRISSGFSMKRFHPIAKTWRAHPAIDYAAPTGTPIKAVGDATISQIGYSKYNGNYIKLRHTGSYETLYLHMSRFAKGMKRGKKISQGKIIGYVGATGLATGPHLCFRMFKNGNPVNPYKIKTPAAVPISREHLEEFQTTLPPLLSQLKSAAGVETLPQPEHSLSQLQKEVDKDGG